MADNAQIKVEAILDDKVSGGMKDMSRNVSQSSSSMSNSAKGLTVDVMSLAKGFAALKVVQVAVGYLKEASAEGIAAAQIFAKLDATVKVTGMSVGLTTRELDRMAGAYQKVTTFGDETIKSAQTQLMLFSNIGKDIFPQLMSATVDVGAAFGSMDSAAQALGRAMESPIEGTRALRQMGIFLTDSQEALIQKFMEQGDILSAQRVILDEVTKRFDGMSEAIARTPVGQLQQAKERLSDIKEEAGVNMIPAITLWYDSLNSILDIMNKIFFVHRKTRAEAQEQIELSQLDTWYYEAEQVKKQIEELTYAEKVWKQEHGKMSVIGGAFDPDTLRAKRAELENLNQSILDMEKKYGINRAGRTIPPSQLSPPKAKAEAKERKLYSLPEEEDIAQALERLHSAEKEAYDFSVSMSLEVRSYQQTARQNELDELQVWYDDKKALAEKHNVDVGVIDEIYASKHAEITKKYALQEAQYKAQMAGVIASASANMFGTLSQLAATNAKESKEAAVAAKALAIGQTIINTAVAVGKANSYGYPWNIALMAIAAATGAAQIGIIASQQFAQGGIVSGPRTMKDTVPARLTGGEMILTEAQQARLFGMANGIGNGGMSADFSITIQGNADAQTVERIAETREEQLARFRAMYNELVYRRQL
jgi:hypothetical protein